MGGGCSGVGRGCPRAVNQRCVSCFFGRSSGVRVLFFQPRRLDFHAVACLREGVFLAPWARPVVGFVLNEVRAAAVSPPVLPTHSVLSRNERLQNEHSKSAGASSSAAAAGNLHSSQRVLKFSKINKVHWHYLFCESRRVRAYLGGKLSDSTVFGFLEKATARAYSSAIV